MATPILHYLVILNSTSLFIHPNGYGLKLHGNEYKYLLTKEVLDFPLCPLMIKDLPSLIKRYWLTLRIKIISHLYTRFPKLYRIHQVAPHPRPLHQCTYIDGKSYLTLIDHSQLHLLVHPSLWVWT